MNTTTGNCRSPELKTDIRHISALFTCFSLLLLWAAWYASSLAPRLMESNYRSVKYGSEMQSALVSIYLDAINAKEPNPEDIARFDKNFSDQSKNITEEFEAEAVQDLASEWTNFSKKPMTPTVESFHRLSAAIERIVTLNEKAMYQKEESAASIGKTVLFGGFLGLFLVVIYAAQITFKIKDP